MYVFMLATVLPAKCYHSVNIAIRLWVISVVYRGDIDSNVVKSLKNWLHVHAFF